MKQSLRGKKILITGAARGIGAEAAKQLAAEGAKIALVGLEPERLSELALELGLDHCWFECDVTDYKSVEKAVKASVAKLGSLDAVITNAGIGCIGTVAIAPVEALAKTIEVNLLGTVHTVSAALPYLTDSRGYFLLVSSATAVNSTPGTAAYAASKSGVEQFANCFRLEVAHKGVDVGVIYPGWVDTDLIRDQKNDLESFNEMVERLPWPFDVETPLDVCGKAIVDCIAYRKRTKFLPASLTPFAAFRQLCKSPVWDFFIKLGARSAIPKAEAEMKKLNSFFGQNSMGTYLLEKDKNKS